MRPILILAALAAVLLVPNFAEARIRRNVVVQRVVVRQPVVVQRVRFVAPPVQFVAPYSLQFNGGGCHVQQFNAGGCAQFFGH